MSVKVKAYAKINLMLDIISTRKDGYHDLFMIMQSINLYDTVTISETKSKKITITCNIDDIPLDEKNIAYKAADAFFKANKIKNKGINIDIVKRIPHQAGLAGGSADGAAGLVALQSIHLMSFSVQIFLMTSFAISVLKSALMFRFALRAVLFWRKVLATCFIRLSRFVSALF